MPEQANDIEVKRSWLIALTVVALALRLINLNSGLWVDEIDSLQTSFRPALMDIITVFPRDNRHPFYSVLAHFCIQLFGEHPWSIRLPAVIFGAATVPALYLLGARIMRRREAFLAAALLAVSYHHVWFSQNARGYALLGFFAVISAWCLLRVMDDPSPRWMVGYGLAIALGAWTHLTMVFVAVGHFAAVAIAFVFARQSRDTATWKRLLIAFVLSGVLTFLCYAPVLGDVTHYFTKKPSGLKGISTPSWAAAETVRVLLAGLGGVGAAVALLALAAGALLFGLGLLTLWRRQRIVLGMFVMPGVVTIAGALAARGTMYPRFFFSMAPYGILILILGGFAVTAALARMVGKDEGWSARWATGLVGALIVLSILSLGREYRLPKQDFEGAQRWVETQRSGQDVVATTDITSGLYQHFYGAATWDSVRTAEDLARLRQAHRVWLVYTFPRYLQRGAPDISAIVEHECGTARVFPGTVGGGDVYVCELGPRS